MKSVVTLGTFDGVHKGHRSILNKLLRRARVLRAQSVVLAFGMPPRHAGEPSTRSVLLTTLPEKLDIFRQLGVKVVKILIFDRKTASTTAEDFFRKIILGRYKACEMMVGPRVAFGKNRTGRLPFLRRMGKAHGVVIHVLGALHGVGGPVSSRRIRKLLVRGEVEKASSLLGYPYSVAGKVVHGARRGRQLGFPTANINVDDGKILPRGVFWVKVLPALAPFPLSLDAAKRGVDGLCNVGIRPTFTPQAQKLHCEVFLFKGRSNLYGRRLRVVFLRKIRSERRFRSKLALSAQIRQDFALARRWAR